MNVANESTKIEEGLIKVLVIDLKIEWKFQLTKLQRNYDDKVAGRASMVSVLTTIFKNFAARHFLDRKF